MSFRNFLQLQIACILLVVGTATSGQSSAMSSGYDAPAQVILKDGVPCFFATIAGDDKVSQYKSFEVRVNRGEKVWHIYDDRGLAPMPSSVEQCIKYGDNWPTGKVLKEASPLKYAVPYRADIGTKYLFRVAFCLSKNTSGQSLLTKWAKDGDHCTDVPLNETNKP
ncbi:hypothetical protein [Collimonas fungivorans]|uniref:hypothetical protein n=1 Tax=Collimonas fungivorans TaxID=158899 RepID=UPI0011D23F22|nr:hypothetical protein [Collimonas fungivorans]